MKVSVIIPCFNVQDCVAAAIASCNARQQGLDIEIVCIDDKSTDKTLSVLEELASSDKRIKVVCNEMNKGQLESRRAGLYTSTGDYVMYLDADDTLGEGTIDAIYTTAIQSNCDIVFFPLEICDNIPKQEAPLELRERASFFERLVGNQEIYCKSKEEAMDNIFSSNRKLLWQLCGKLYKRETLIQAHELLPSGECFFMEDACAFLLVISMAKAVSYCKKGAYIYDLTSGITSLSGRNEVDSKRLVQMLASYAYVKAFARKYTKLYIDNTKYMKCLSFLTDDMAAGCGLVIQKYVEGTKNRGTGNGFDLSPELCGLFEYAVDMERCMVDDVKQHICGCASLFLFILKIQSIFARGRKKEEIKARRRRVKTFLKENRSCLRIPSM